MVRFEFTLSDIDASNLVDIIQGEKVRILALALDDLENMDWYKKQADYLENMKQTVVAGSTRP
jgi:hypothetical protein